MERIQVQILGTLNSSFSELVSSWHGQIEKGQKLTKFSGLPTFPIFSPSNNFPGSLHYMRVLPGLHQGWHFHPGERYIILICDSEVYIKANTNPILGEQSPEVGCQTFIVPENSICCVRFCSDVWHQFSTSETGLGALAFTFHSDDETGGHADADLMVEKTTFFE